MSAKLRELAKVGLDCIQGLGVSLLKAGKVIDFPVPPNSSMRKTSSKTIRHYYISGLTTYLPIATIALNYGVKFDESTNVLDFGCGVGRQLLHMTRNFPRANYYACDVDSSAIAFIRKEYPKVKSTVNQFVPPLEYANGQMDLTYTVSTFSHFDLATQRLWLQEIFRITRPGGIAILTVEGERALPYLMQEFGDEAAIREKLRTDGILYKEYEWLKETQRRGAINDRVDPSKGLGDTYGNTVVTPEFIRQNWTASGFEVAGIAPGIIGMRQDLVALRRPL